MSITMHIEGVLLLTIAGALLLSHRKQLYASLPVHAFSHLIQICRHIYKKLLLAQAWCCSTTCCVVCAPFR